MKKFFFIISPILIIVSLVVLAFTFRQIHQQEEELTEDLKTRTELLTDSLKEAIKAPYLSNEKNNIDQILNKFAGRGRILGISVYDNNAEIFAFSEKLAEKILEDNKPLAEQVMDSDSSKGDFIKHNKNTFYVFITPLHLNEKVVGAVSVFQKADYIHEQILNTWKTNIWRLFIQVFLFSISAVLILNWLIYRPILNIIEIIRKTKDGSTKTSDYKSSNHFFFSPLLSEINKLHQHLNSNKTPKSFPKKTLEKVDSPWTANRLKEFFSTYLKNRKIFVVSNREPYIHSREKDQITWKVPASGMITALEPIMEACGGTWIAHGSGNADQETVDENNKVKVPPSNPKYTLKRVWLSPEEIKGHYVGFSNEALWPLCIFAHNRPIFRKSDWQIYREVNGKFAKSLLKEIKNVENPIILIQDYHFALLPAMIKKSRPDAEIGFFWHIPWPNSQIFSICPYRKEILKGMLGADVLGFHTQQFCNYFFESVGKEIEALIDLEKFSITHEKHESNIKPFPISVPFSQKSLYPKNSEIIQKFKIKTEFLAIGVDRLDYAKGLVEKFKGVEFFLSDHPEYLEKFTLLQIAPTTREEVQKYREFNEEVSAEAERINQRFKTFNWKPIIFI